MAGTEPRSNQFSYFYCGFFVESICVRCSQTVARGSTQEALHQQEESHSCSRRPDET